jgi:hypothetical protein
VLSKSDPPLNPAGMLSPVREKGSKIAGIDRPLDGEDDNKVLVSMKRLYVLHLPSPAQSFPCFFTTTRLGQSLTG